MEWSGWWCGDGSERAAGAARRARRASSQAEAGACGFTLDRLWFLDGGGLAAAELTSAAGAPPAASSQLMDSSSNQ